MSWVTPPDVTGAWIGDGKPTDSALVQVWIDKAERRLQHLVPDLKARIDLETALEVKPLTDAAKDVIVAMVTRVFRNPEGIRQVQSTEGPYSGTKTYGGNTPGGLEPTGDELSSLIVTSSSGAFTIDLIPSTSPFYRA